MGLFKNIVTFGASGRIEDAQDGYEARRREYTKITNQLKVRSKEIEALFQKVVKVKVKVQKIVSKDINYFIPSKLTIKDKQEKIIFGSEDFSYVSNSLEMGNVVMDAMKSGGIALTLGTTAAPAALWLVGNFGVASTGAAIASLSGAAATSATLAALGGGALTVGGGGVVAGTAVLSVLGPIGVALGAVTLPLFTHLSANKKIKEIKEKEYEIIEGIDKIEGSLLKIDVYEKRSYELIDGLEKGIEAFVFMSNKIKKELFPFGILSKYIRKMRAFFIKLNPKNKHKNYEIVMFTGKEWERIHLLCKESRAILEMRDAPILDVKKN